MKFEESITQSTKVDQSTSISPQRLYNSPTKILLRKTHAREIALVKRKLCITKYQKNRLQKQVHSLKTILKELRNKRLITLEESDILEHLDEGMRQIAKRERRKQKKLPVPRMYEPSLRQFALTLHFYSPKAYNYVRYKFFNNLPHVKTISKWYRSLGGEPGIHVEALQAIKLRVHAVSYKLIGALMFDEMAIRQHLDYNSGKIIGYVDCGSNIQCDTTAIAREALVYCVVCINEGWKLPIAFFLINGISMEQKRNLTEQCLTALQETGMLIVSLTCDGLSSNLSMLQSLGCNFNSNSNNFQSWFKHPASDTNVHVFLDPSHMIKLVRNTLGQIKELVNGDGNKIQWKYFEELHKLQENEGLHLGNKLRTKHLEYYKNKMKVKLATQLLSTSVSNAFEFCKNILMLPEFQDCSATITFTSIFNDLFDIFNSKNEKQCNLKKPICGDNYDIISKKLEECIQYIKSLSLVKKSQSILHSKNKTGFLGFLINIQSMLHMYKFLCIDHNFLKYIAMYKISQDHLELIFSSIRSHGGYNNNPTVKQFKSAIKKLIVHCEIKEGNTGNCIPLENISILNVSSANKSINIINATTTENSTRKWLHILDTENIDDHTYCIPFPWMTEYKNEVIRYIAGYILRKLMKTLHCTECVNALKEQHTCTSNSLINIKSRGFLLHPSKDLVYICKQAEDTIHSYIHTEKNLNNFNTNMFICDVMQKLIHANIFETLKEHISDQCFSSNHVNHLLRITIHLYSKIRLSHYISNVHVSERHKLNKLILFKGQ